jgi:COP9 signalosome complex subunit 6
MANEAAGSLLASQPSGSGLQVTLHPLPILSLSDLITRAVVRRSNNPVVIALLGQQNGLAVTVEESFDCAVVYGGGADLTLDDVWFRTRLEQSRCCLDHTVRFGR